MSGRATLTIEEAAELLGISRGLAYEAARRNELPGVLRVGRRILISKPALHAALGLTAAGADPSQTNGAGVQPAPERSATNERVASQSTRPTRRAGPLG